jgi:hypothetical protein
LEEGLKKIEERKKGSTSSSPWTPFTPQLFMVSSRRTILFSWILHPMI